MSTAPSTPTTAAAYESELITNYCTYAALALIAHEHMITFEYEYKFLFQRKWTAATWLFISNRYTLLGMFIAQSVPYSAQRRCYDSSLQNFSTFLFNAPTIILILFSALRIFALLDRAYFIAGCALLLGLAQVGIAFYEGARSFYTYVDDPTIGRECFSNISLSASVAFHIASTLCMIALEVVALVTTWLKTYRHARQAASVGIRVTFAATLMRYGTLYFAVLAAVNILPVIILVTPPSTSLASAMNALITILPNIVLSRFLINLREVESPAPSSISRFSQFSAPSFRVPTLGEILGNLGEPLANDGEDLDAEAHGGESEVCEECSNEQQDRRDEGDEAVLYGLHSGISSDEILELFPELKRYGLRSKLDGQLTVLLLLLLPAALRAISWLLRRRRAMQLMPPGPPGIPLLGNALQVPNNKVFLKFTKWGRTYGPIYSLNMLGKPTVVLNSLKVGTELLDRRSTIYSDRPRMILASEILLGDATVPFSHYGPRWRKQRRALHEALNVRAVEAYTSLQEHTAVDMVLRILDDPDDWQKHFERATSAGIMSFVYGAGVPEEDRGPFMDWLWHLIHEVGRLAGKEVPLVEFFPILRHTPSWMAKWKCDAENMFHEYSTRLLGLTQTAQEQQARRLSDVLRTLGKTCRQYRAQLVRVCLACRYDSTYSVLSIFVLIMLWHPDIMQNAHDEIDRTVGRERLPTLEDQRNLPYVEAIVMELLRWWPVVPLGIPRSAMEDDWYDGYFIPKGTTVIENLWAMGRNPDDFPEPDEFRPERILDEDENNRRILREMRTQLKKPFAFGLGRRLCPGINLAMRALFIDIACLLWAFEFSPVQDETGAPVLPSRTECIDGGLVTSLRVINPFASRRSRLDLHCFRHEDVTDPNFIASQCLVYFPPHRYRLQAVMPGGFVQQIQSKKRCICLRKGTGCCVFQVALNAVYQLRSLQIVDTIMASNHRRTPQGVHSKTFRPPPFDHDLSVPGLYEYHAKNSPDHPVFTYADVDANTLHDISYSDAWNSIITLAEIVRQNYERSQHKSREARTNRRPVIGVLALSDTLTYVYMLVAIMSLGYTAFPLSPRNNPGVTAHLLEITGVQELYVSEDSAMQALASESAKLLSEKGLKVELLQMVKFTGLQGAKDRFEQFTRQSVVDIEDNDVTLILHSSGTTALPKAIRVTRRGLINSCNIPYFGEVDLADKRIAAHTNPMFHAMGIATLLWPLTSGATFALYKPTSPPTVPTPSNFLKSWSASGCHIVFCIPVFIEAWAREPTNIARLKALDAIVFSGASVNKHLGDMLAEEGVIMHPFWGSTEVGPVTMYIPRDAAPPGEWEYFRISHHAEFAMLPQEGMDGIYEPVMIPTDTCFPNIYNSERDGRPVYAVGDLLEQHPTDTQRWKVYGRKDDLIILATGENVNPLPLEATLVHDSHIASAIVFGKGHIETGVLIEPAVGYNPSANPQTLEDFKSLIWPTVEKANAQVPAYARIQRKACDPDHIRIVVTSPTKPLEYTSKGTPRRPVCLGLYAAEIESVYADEEDLAAAGDREFPDRV
ncbi:hypothetical protein NM688_g1205 [Phlebia brevispora]|uniref:Uncharacterized protein n=1 Tax=Phlebia brevispora TaxID=194682 RepID=A0ACC1TC69_9APHY|nr:hypothetical protein NM688_g1205 [Phlebia brevispora]